VTAPGSQRPAVGGNRVSNAKQGFGLAGPGVYRDNTAANITTSPFVLNPIFGTPVNGGGNVP
jgi:hypothetical protein